MVDEQEGELKKKKQRAESRSTNPIDNHNTTKDPIIQSDHQKVYILDLLPNWIQNSEFIKQFREDYNDEETLELNEELVFQCPLTLSSQQEVSRLLESMRFFGVSKWEVIILIISFSLNDDTKEVGTLKLMFPEFKDLWNNVDFLRDEGLNDSTCIKSAEKGFVYALQYAHENGCPWDKWTCQLAASGEHLKCLKYAHENGCPWDINTCQEAASGGHLKCLQYAHENGCPWDEKTCSEAAGGGHLNCLQYAHENGCPWDEKTCLKAAGGGDLNCLQYAHENGCPWDEETCSEAACGGDLNCLEYAHENGCPWDKWTCLQAIYGGYIHCLEYARENGCPKY